MSADTTLHLHVAPCDDGFVAGQNEANARLIAAVPELLKMVGELAEALHDAALDADGEAVAPMIVEDARDLIAKATGETP